MLCVDNLFTDTKRNIEHLPGHPRFEFMRHDVTFPLFVEVDVRLTGSASELKFRSSYPASCRVGMGRVHRADDSLMKYQ